MKNEHLATINEITRRIIMLQHGNKTSEETGHSPDPEEAGHSPLTLNLLTCTKPEENVTYIVCYSEFVKLSRTVTVYGLMNNLPYFHIHYTHCHNKC